MLTERRPRIDEKRERSGSGAREDVRPLIPAIGLKEYWYPAIEDRMVGKKPVGMKIVGEQVVFFRGGDGRVKALDNVCAHRGGSLMHGDCHYPGTISCPYHGWTYDGDGNVLAVLPEGPDSQVPGKVQQRAHPTKTLRGLVFVWMGDGEPAPIEEDVPPEFFRADGILLYAWEVWPVNWRQSIENAGDAHVPYVHRDAFFSYMSPMSSNGPSGRRQEIVNGRAARNQPAPAGAGSGRGARGANYRVYLPALGAKWPRYGVRRLWSWAFNWAARRRVRAKPIEHNPEWSPGAFGSMHHLPAMIRLDYRTHLYTRTNIPIDEDNTRQCYYHFTPVRNPIGKLYEFVMFHVWHRWGMYSNFSVQDFRATQPQRYDQPEYLSPTDSRILMWRRLLLQARGMDQEAAEEVLPMESVNDALARR